jgi:hypothetical protein
VLTNKIHRNIKKTANRPFEKLCTALRISCFVGIEIFEKIFRILFIWLLVFEGI